jgi:hypothetical protein
MCFGGSPSAPPPPPQLPEAPRTPDVTAGAGKGDADKRKRAAAGGGASGTILTSPQGVASGAATTTKTLLGA